MISDNSIERLCKIFGWISSQEENEVEVVSSKQLADAIGSTEYTVRKDLSLLGACGYTRKGYIAKSLKDDLGGKLNLNKKLKACIVGLGRLGCALLDYEKFQEDGFEIVAGFDRSINKLERIKTSIEVFSDNDIENIVKLKSIDLGIIAVPADSAQNVADKLIKAKVKGILNFSQHKVIVPENIIYLNLDFTNALRFIAAKITMGKTNKKQGERK